MLTDPTRHLMPPFVRFILRIIRVDDFLTMRIEASTPGAVNEPG